MKCIHVKDDIGEVYSEDTTDICCTASVTGNLKPPKPRAIHVSGSLLWMCQISQTVSRVWSLSKGFYFGNPWWSQVLFHQHISLASAWHQYLWISACSLFVKKPVTSLEACHVLFIRYRFFVNWQPARSWLFVLPLKYLFLPCVSMTHLLLLACLSRLTGLCLSLNDYQISLYMAFLKAPSS